MQAQTKPAGLLRTHALLITVVTLLTVVGALAVALSGNPPYVSDSRVVVLPERVKGGGTPLEPNMGTEREIAVSGTVARTAASQLGLTEGDFAEMARAGVRRDLPDDQPGH